ncbi:MAG TPA: hypothetical protein VGE04_13245 [Chloroflexia bacterium]
MAENVDSNGKGQRPETSHLFLVRLWEGPGDSIGPEGASGGEWKGKVQHVVSGEAHNFEDLPSLLDYLRAMMAQG